MKDYTPLGDTEPIRQFLLRIKFLGGVTDDQRKEVAGLLEVGGFTKGEFICQKGEEPTRIYIIKKGRVGLLITSDEATIKKREFDAGDCFGEAAFLSSVNNTASFVAEEDCEVIMLSWHALNRLRRKNPDLACTLVLNLAKDLAKKLQFTDEILVKE